MHACLNLIGLIDVLMEKSLITINREGTLLMHDLLQEIVRRESPKEPGR